jgi:hypothetical protein
MQTLHSGYSEIAFRSMNAPFIVNEIFTGATTSTELQQRAQPTGRAPILL